MKASSANEAGLTGCHHVENLKWIHIYHVIPLHRNLLHPLSLLHLRGCSLGIHPLGHQVSTGLGTLSPMGSKANNPL